MMRASKRWISLYSLLLVTLACLGVYNQTLYKHHNELIDLKERLSKEKTELRVAANTINGHLAVRQWAERHGMVSVTLLPQEGINANIPLPTYQPPTTGLELSTRWR